MANKVVPKFNYSGEFTTGADENYWYIYCKTTGDLSFIFPKEIDVTVVGGGGGGANRNGEDGGGGGEGGAVTVKKGIDLAANTDYRIVIGTGGTGGPKINYDGSTSGTKSTAFGVTAAGGNRGSWRSGGKGAGNGGDGGTGGESSSSTNATAGGIGVRAFSESAYGYYGGGGGGGQRRNVAATNNGGNGGGGNGGAGYEGNHSGGNATANTGGGGGGSGGESDGTGGNGANGIVIIRGSEQDYVNAYFNGTRLTEVYYNGTKLTSWVHNGVKLFFERLRRTFGKAVMA